MLKTLRRLRDSHSDLSVKLCGIPVSKTFCADGGSSYSIGNKKIDELRERNRELEVQIRVLREQIKLHESVIRAVTNRAAVSLPGAG